jgi:hypothetical protein
MYSFVLNSPRGEEAFLRETRTALAALGFTAAFLPNGFANIAAAIDPIRTSITVNAGIFSGASVLVLLLAVFLYIRQWHKSVAIAKALGIPSSKVLGQLFAPILLLWVPAAFIGSAAGWFFALGEAEAILSGLAGYEAYPADALLGMQWLPVMAGVITLFICTGVYVLGINSVRRPVLEQLQGTVQKRRKEKAVDSGVVPEDFIVGNFTLLQGPLIKRRTHALRSFMRHGLRHILRSRMKTGLTVMLALLFVFSLGWLNDMIHSTEDEVERLWTQTLIHAEVGRVIDPFEEGGEAGNLSWWPAVITPASWDAITATGFVTDAYLESLMWGFRYYFMGISHLEGFIAENTKTPLDGILGIFCDDIEIEFAPGFGAEDFTFVPGIPTPVIAQREYLEEHGVALGDAIIFFTDVSDLGWVENDGILIGVFDGGLRRGVNRLDTGVLVMPLAAVYHHAHGFWLFDENGWGIQTGRPAYMTARFTANPALNRELYQLRELIETPLAQNHLGMFAGSVPLELILEDDVIENVILPLERNLSLLKVLYPIAIGSAFVLALGLSLLTMLQNAKNAAIMRVLGKSKAVSQLALCMEQLLVCVTGIALGFIALTLTGVAAGITPLALAGVYFAGAVLGSALGAVVISAKPPLELLQVRE